MAGRVEGRDDNVFAGDGRVVEPVPSLIDEIEGRHRDELARKLSQAEVDLVVAGISGAGYQLPSLEAEQERLDLARDDRDRHRLLIAAQPDAVASAHSHRQGQTVALLRG